MILYQWLLVAINGYSINDYCGYFISEYSWSLMAILLVGISGLMVIGGYFIILVVINGSYINGYWWLSY